MGILQRAVSSFSIVGVGVLGFPMLDGGAGNGAYGVASFYAFAASGMEMLRRVGEFLPRPIRSTGDDQRETSNGGRWLLGLR